jgi:hypothetical protein
MLELLNNELVFRFPEVHPNAELRVNLQRTLRIPDDGKTYPLPPGLGRFPALMVDDYKDRVPSHWREHGGVFVPMYASEALWIAFARGRAVGGPVYPFAVRVAAGKINAVSGDGWSDVMTPGDHVVTPPQPWLDGFAVEKGKIRQFVAAPLGMGLTVEQQLTGKEEHGGIQIEVRPLKASEYEKLVEKDRLAREAMQATRQARFPRGGGGVLRSAGKGGMSIGSNSLGGMTYDSAGMLGEEQCYGAVNMMADMGLGAGGMMTQHVYEDTFGIDAWESAKSRVFLHLANSLAWEAITGIAPPPSPCTVETYARSGLPWFDHYVEGAPVADGGKNLKGVKSVQAMANAKGVPFLPTNGSVDVPPEKVVKLGDKAVRDGNW